MAKRKKKHDEHIDESWLIPYADILTLLLALFIVLFASSSVDSQKFQQMMNSFNSALTGGVGVLDMPSPVDPVNPVSTSPIGGNADIQLVEKKKYEQQMNFLQETEKLEQLKQQLDIYLEENSLTGKLHTKVTEAGLLITIMDNALFASGSAQVRADAKELASEISKLLEPDGRRVTVSGHTDNVPIRNSQFSSNWQLSSQRALNFMTILLENKKLDPRNFSAIAYGEYHPTASNDTAEGRAKNRRVELAILRNFEKEKTE
ncbi:flagellar motor protein MotB [Brevibacillus daliensis]|uniref:flagellar motor protein MotB n=1 Tax=Brevibacillus daliensis TaxID=2892995 RepID=UPI001E59599B|nr:flagellar motor protein MotB [Brevibacillus daliensis]